MEHVELDGRELERRLRIIFGRRLDGFSFSDDDLLAYWIVKTGDYRKLNGQEIIDVIAALGIQSTQVEFEDSPPNAVRFVADLSSITKPEIPALIRKETPSP